MSNIVLIGGHDRMHFIYKKICKKSGHKVKVFTQMPASFSRQIGNPDGILLFTKTVSHKMVGVALKEAKKKNIPVVRCHNSSTSSLEASIKVLEGHQV